MRSRWSLLLALVTAAGGCVEIDAEPVFFEVALEPASIEGFVTETGWSVTLDQAVVAVGPLYLRDESLRFRGASHGGDAEGLDETLAAEFIQQVAFDLTGTGRVVGEGRGSARRVDVFEPVLVPPHPAIIGDASALGDAPAWVSGVATRDAIVLEFVGELPHLEAAPDADDSDDADSPGHGGELEIEPFELSEGGTLTLVIDPAAWFEAAQFDQLVQTDAQGRYVITPASQVGLAWDEAQIEAFAPSWTPAPGAP